MSFQYQKVSYNYSTLEDWKRYLDPTELAIFESELSDFEWFVVLEKGKVIAVFQIINVLSQYSKNLTIHFHPNFEQNNYNIISIIIFMYESMLSICDANDIKKLKLFIDDSLINAIFNAIAKHQMENKNIVSTKNYRKWIEIIIK